MVSRSDFAVEGLGFNLKLGNGNDIWDPHWVSKGVHFRGNQNFIQTICVASYHRNQKQTAYEPLGAKNDLTCMIIT